MPVAGGRGKCPAVRFSPLLLFFALLCVSGGSLFAQQQEKKLSERLAITEADAIAKGMKFDVRNTMGSSNRAVATNSANVKAFYGAQAFTSKNFESKEFAGSKSSWFGNFKFATKEKETRKFATKDAVTKTMAVKDARESDKTMPSRDLPGGDRTFLGKESEKLHHTPNEQSMRTFDKSELVQLKSIDDIRELLNKNK
ncbi:MAG: hypothetical protein JWL90_3597 [Chthoniobacteraceae bacterium]|nr:hypothetical protein [Chthoniobacteraceae bacterium]